MINLAKKQLHLLVVTLLYDNGRISKTNIIIMAAFVLFVAGTIVDIVFSWYGKIWTHYQQFSDYTGGGSIGGKILQSVVKYSNDTWGNSERGKPVGNQTKPLTNEGGNEL